MAGRMYGFVSLTLSVKYHFDFRFRPSYPFFVAGIIFQPQTHESVRPSKKSRLRELLQSFVLLYLECLVIFLNNFTARNLVSLLQQYTINCHQVRQTRRLMRLEFWSTRFEFF
jgi:hypothetical protein